MSCMPGSPMAHSNWVGSVSFWDVWDTSMTGGGKLGCPIKVKTGRETIRFKDCPGYQETSLQIFLFLKQAIERFAGGESHRERACAPPVLIVVSSFDGVVVSVFSLGTREAVTRAAGSLC